MKTYLSVLRPLKTEWDGEVLFCTVLAVEGFEGTDKCLARGGELAGKDGGAVAIKVAKLNHDMRFDIPCMGPQTFETCA